MHLTGTLDSLSRYETRHVKMSTIAQTPTFGVENSIRQCEPRCTGPKKASVLRQWRKLIPFRTGSPAPCWSGAGFDLNSGSAESLSRSQGTPFEVRFYCGAQSGTMNGRWLSVPLRKALKFVEVIFHRRHLRMRLRKLIVENHIQQRPVNMDALLVIDKSKLAEPVHEEADS